MKAPESAFGWLLFFAASCASDATVPETPGTATVSEPTATAPGLLEVVAGVENKIRLRETARSDRTSTVVAEQESSGSPTMDIFLLFDAVCKLTEARGAKYFILLEERRDPHGEWRRVIGYADTDAVDLHEYFGPEYTLANPHGQLRTFFSVAEWKALRREGWICLPVED